MRFFVLATMLIAGTFAQAANYMCMDGLSAQYQISINELSGNATLMPTGPNQMDEIKNVRASFLNPAVIQIRFKENGSTTTILIDRAGIESKIITGNLPMRDLYCELR